MGADCIKPRHPVVEIHNTYVYFTTKDEGRHDRKYKIQHKIQEQNAIYGL